MVEPDAENKRLVNRFLKTGSAGRADPGRLTDACDRYIRSQTQISASKAIRLARQFVQQAKRFGGDTLLTALRCAGWAYVVAGDYATAKDHYLAARSFARGNPLVQARIDRVLIDVYMYLAKPSEARRRARQAISTFRRLRAPDEIAKTKVNYANVLHRQDRHRDAYRLYHEASEHFRRSGDDTATALCWYNEANTLVQLFDFKRATALYGQAREIFLCHGHDLHATGCLYGLAWLHMLEGDFHVALQKLNECERYYRRGRLKRESVLCQLDRAESYLGLNLYVDARRAAETAAAGARELGISYETAKACFFAAKASAGMGHLREARRRLHRAEKEFESGGNIGFLAAVRFMKVQLGPKTTAYHRKLYYARQHLAKAQLPLWEAICDLEIAATQPSDTASIRRLAYNHAAQVVPHIAAGRHTVLGDRAAGRRQLSRAVDQWTRAAEILDAVRAKLPPLEMRSSFFAHQSDPFRKLIDVQSERDPMAAAVWSERCKTVGLWAPSESIEFNHPSRHRVRQSLSELAREVGAITSALSKQHGHRSLAPGRLAQSQRQFFNKVQHELSALYTNGGVSAATNQALAELMRRISDRRTVVLFHLSDEDMIAFVIEQGQCRAHRYSGGVRRLGEYVSRWRFLLECAPANGERPRRADLQEETRLLEQLSSWVLPPLELPTSMRQLLLVPEGQLYSVPWSALSHQGIPLCERCPLSLIPSVRHFDHARRHRNRSRRAAVFVGASEGLPYVREEVRIVREHLAGLELNVYDPCRRADWPDDSSACVWHFSGHARLCAENPFYSALQLVDEPMFAADFRLRTNHVNTAVLAACRTGQQTSLPGEESAGLVRAFLEMGARSVLAGGWAISDTSTAVLMDAFYKSLTKGATASRALRSATGAVRERFPSAYHWGAFSVYGAG